MLHVAAIIAAGGRGLRIGADRPKQFLELGGRSILDLTVEALAASDRIHEIVVALPHDHLGATAESWKGKSAKPLRFVEGGERRQDSVARAFGSTSPRADIILIHDAARPFVTADVIARTIDAATTHGAAIAAIAVSDTVKQVGEAAGGSRPIRATIARETIFLAQTPQVFRRDILARALEFGNNIDATDEAMLVERLGLPVHVVDGDVKNIKVTTAEDLAEARRRSAGEGLSPRLTRIGTGYDLHRLVAGRPLILAGVRIPFDLGLDGHSDADIVCHAVTDAVLGAAAAGDIGRLFPDTDPKWKDADSIALLESAIERVSALGYRVSNVDVTVIAQQPKLLPHLDAMRDNLAAALQVDRQAVSIKGKTNEGVDSTGRGEAMACHAVVLLRS
ncbi:MAG: 2-C-methyl-D-erythritol 4-phosphate cytidylyltransferase [Acidobacteriota bacterium]|nr:2-C-methyl-D-erythritol 4-phosphate cytidylyltransferase [Acidobacteriota bacterium]